MPAAKKETAQPKGSTKPKRAHPQKVTSTSWVAGQPSPNPDGRPGHIPTVTGRRTVEAMAAVGIPQSEIARVLEIDDKTLRLHYREELDTAAIKANARVAQSLYSMAVGDPKNGIPPSFQAAKWWTQSRMGWKATVEVTSSDLKNAVSIAARYLAARVLEDGEDDE